MKWSSHRSSVIIIFLTIFCLFLTSCGQSSQPVQSTSQQSQQIRVAFIYKDKSADYNWSYIHELGRQYLAKQLPDIETKTMDSITVDQAEKVLRDLANQGYKLIFATAPEFSAAVLKVAKDFPNTRFEVCQGSQTAANVATYDGRMYQVFYLAGGYAGMMTTSGIIGFVAPEPTVEVIRDINAITLSIRWIRKSENVTVHVKWTGSWNDPQADRKAAEDLIKEGADVLVQHTYSPEVQKVAEEHKIRSYGYGFDMRQFAPTANATSLVWSWGWYYVQRVKALTDGSWKGEAYFGKVAYDNFGKGIIDLAPYTYDQIPQISEAVPMKWRSRFVETKRDVFEGPITAQNGDSVLATGSSFDDSYIYKQMNWFVEGVVGDAPGKPPAAVQ